MKTAPRKTKKADEPPPASSSVDDETNNKKKKMASFTTSDSDADVTVNKAELSKLLKSAEGQRQEQMTVKKLKLREKLLKDVRLGKLTKSEMEAAFSAECMTLERIARNERDKINVRQEHESAIIIGDSKKPKRGQMHTTIDPFDDDNNVIQVGTLPEKKEWIPLAVRIDYQHTFVVEKVVFKPTYNQQSEVTSWVWR